MPISIGQTVWGYPSHDKSVLSFPANAKVTIYSKPAPTNLKQHLWEGEIEGTRGLIPKRFVREFRIVSKKTVEVGDDEVKPDAVQKAFEVIDGTTVYGNDGAESAVTESPTQVIATPKLNATASEEDTTTSQKSGNVEYQIKHFSYRKVETLYTRT